jgi:hypothetical protein
LVDEPDDDELVEPESPLDPELLEVFSLAVVEVDEDSEPEEPDESEELDELSELDPLAVLDDLAPEELRLSVL